MRNFSKKIVITLLFGGLLIGCGGGSSGSGIGGGTITIQASVVDLITEKPDPRYQVEIVETGQLVSIGSGGIGTAEVPDLDSITLRTKGPTLVQTGEVSFGTSITLCNKVYNGDQIRALFINNKDVQGSRIEVLYQGEVLFQIGGGIVCSSGTPDSCSRIFEKFFPKLPEIKPDCLK